MIVGEGIVANSGGGSGANQADVYVYSAKASSADQPLKAVVNNLFTIDANRLIALKAGNYKIEAYMSASSNWTRMFVDQQTRWDASYTRVNLRLFINSTEVTSWSPSSSVPSAGSGNPYTWSSSITRSLNANDVINFAVSSTYPITQYGGIIIRITEV